MTRNFDIIVLAFKNEKGILADVEVGKVPLFVRHIRPERPTHDNVPQCTKQQIELFFQERSDIFLHIVC